MAGITPFLFTSERELAETGKWYEMYINPEGLTLNNSQLNTKVMTKAAIAHIHWRSDLPTVSCNGASGWILKESILQSTTKNAVKQLVDTGKVDFVKIGKDAVNQVGKDLLSLNRTNISITPREFIQSLQDIALEDMYYIDSDGLEWYNQKKILIYTKRYPLGIILNGFFQKFTIPEQAADPQIIKYSFEFVVENSDDSNKTTSFLKNAIRELIVANPLKVNGLFK